MRPSLLSTVLFLLTAFTQSSIAIESLPNSPCSVQCGNVQGSTTGSDIVCKNGDFASTATGVTFQSCVTCQLGSTYIDPATKKTDFQFALYNLRYAVSWCLFGYPNNTNVPSTPCITSTACQPIENAIEFDSLNAAAATYSYCALMSAVAVPKCNACLAQQKDQIYINNFVIALNGACQQQPTPGHTISLNGSLFSTTTVNVTSPSAIPSGTYTPSNEKFTLGAKIGVAVGGIIILLAMVGACIIWRGRKRRQSFLLRHQQQTGYAEWVAAQQSIRSPPPSATFPNGGLRSPRRDQFEASMGATQSGGAFFDSPQSQKPLVASMPWGGGMSEDMSPANEKVYFSPYSSNYNSPVSATDQVQTVGQQWPLDGKDGVAGTSGFGRSFQNRSRSREKKDSKGDHFEMQVVAPTLEHPGHGRQGSDKSLGLTEEDHRRGDAV
ncbi:hypothetical protein BGZ57DRAFT_866801 [Hyaloscypha finlandica]|nr:hypothetical protein BGZ57DRAFT_866801 [Hyaloscypha finlandica]